MSVQDSINRGKKTAGPNARQIIAPPGFNTDIPEQFSVANNNTGNSVLTPSPSGPEPINLKGKTNNADSEAKRFNKQNQKGEFEL